MYKDTTRKFSATGHLFTMWKASCFKLIWHDITLWIVAYSILSGLYRKVFFEEPKSRQIFELVCVYADRFSSLIPITFLTGFYVSQVVNRWWDQFMSLPWPDRLALKLVSFCPGTDDFNKNLRRTVMRYVNLSTILVYRLVSEKVMARFPDYDTLIKAKLMLPNEVKRLEKTDQKTPHESTWIPILWAMKLLTRARTEGKIEVEAPIFANLQSSFESVESANRKILNYGWVNFPLAYTQVATMSVYLYFLSALFGRQYLIPRPEEEDSIQIFPNVTIPFSITLPFRSHTPDFYVPVFTLAEMFCYMGWIKVAETLLNPFGDDDEDFHINYLIDRNLQVSYIIVDEADRDMDMAADPFLEAGIDIPKELPYQKKPKLTPKLRMKINSRRNSAAEGLDGVSVVGGGGTVAPSLVRATSNTMISISRFRKRLSRSYLKANDAYDIRNDETGPRGIEVPGAANSRGYDTTASMPHGLKIAGQIHVDNMSPIPGSDNSKEDENEANVPFPFSNFEAPHEHPTGLLEAAGGHHENRMMDSSNSGYYNGGYVTTENMNGGRSIPPIGPI